MKKFMQFFSFAAMTQVILLLNQVVLLPMQIRLWGVSETASWYAAIALATVTTVADLGLRTAGHVELLRLVQEKDAAGRAEFRQLWAWIRLLVLCVCALLLIADFLYGRSHGLEKWQLSRALLTLAYAMETVLIVRIVYLDSLGEYSRAESSYFAFAAVRLALAVPALVIFRFNPLGLGWLFFATSMLGLVLQGLICRIPAELHLFSPMPRRLSFRSCLLARYTMAEPCANWVRLSLPVLVIAAVAPATAVTTYVALRAVYGAARTTIQQVARVASVEAIRFRAAGDRETAESVLTVFVLLAALLGTALAGFVVLDNVRILSLWLKHFDRLLFQNVNLTFALSSPFYSYQVMVALSFRIGQLAIMARRQYAYVLYSALFAGVALFTKTLAVYLVLLVVAEITLSLSFMARSNIGGATGFRTKAGWRGLAASFAGTALVLVLWMTVRHSSTDFFVSHSLTQGMQAILLLASGLSVLLVLNFIANTGMFLNLRNAMRSAGSTVNA
jgi:hypothetical protein